MVEWVRVYDHEALPLERFERRFRFHGGEYEIVWEPESRDWLTMRFRDGQERWHVLLKEIGGGGAMLSGMTDQTPVLLGEAYWFQLLIADRPLITYWGNQVVHRADYPA